MALVAATPDQLRARLQNSALPDDVAQQAIDDAFALVRAVSGQDYSYVENDMIEIPGGRNYLVLPQRPVIVDDTHPLAISERYAGSLLWSPALIEGAGYYRNGHLIYRLPGYGIHKYSSRNGWWSPLVRVTYTHGFLRPPDWLTTLVLDAAAMYATNPQGLRSETVGGITLTWSREALSGDVAEMIRTRLSAMGETSNAFSIRTIW